MRLNFPTVLAVSGFALAGLVACSPSEDAPAETIEADVPPIEVASEAEDVSVSEPIESEAASVAEVATDAEDDHDHAGEAHDEHEGHHDDTHDHKDDHDHADEDSHDHHDHDHGVGEAHVHGAGEMAIVLDGATLTVSFESPLASFASFEHEPKTPEQEAELQAVNTALMQPSSMITLNDEAGCASTSQGVSFRHSGDHGSIMVDYAFECVSAGDLSAVDLKVFAAYPALETIDVVFLNGADQTARTLSASDARLSLN